jgi:pyruvate/2-oxoglutarate dehydrogenase complex dihydrolipoamide acyltransferase (E2) component
MSSGSCSRRSSTRSPSSSDARPRRVPEPRSIDYVAQTFRLPDLGEGIDGAEVLRWLAREGEDVAAGTPVVEIHTDKATLEVPAPTTGTLLQIVAPVGSIVAVGGMLGVIGAAGEQLLYAVDTPVDQTTAERPPVEIVPDPPVRFPGPGAPSGQTRVPIRGVRRAIVDRVSRSHREVAAVTFVEECDVSHLSPGRLLPAAVRATALALVEHPELNARIEGDSIVLVDHVDVGVTVETDEGVVVPVVRHADRLGPAALDRELSRLDAGAREGTLAPDELRGSTFTVTVGDALGGVLMTPLVNHPEVGILAVHRPSERPVVRDGRVVVRTMANVSVTFDHRAVDAPAAAAFCLDVISRLEHGHVDRPLD